MKPSPVAGVIPSNQIIMVVPVFDAQFAAVQLGGGGVQPQSAIRSGANGGVRQSRIGHQAVFAAALEIQDAAVLLDVPMFVGHGDIDYDRVFHHYRR